MKSIAFPSGMREHTLSKRRVFMISLRPVTGAFIIFLFLLTGIFFWSAVREYGVAVLAHPRFWIGPYLEYVWILIPLFGLVCAVVYRMAGGQKTAGIPVWYGFDEKGVYFHDEFGSVMYTWEYFSSLRETHDFFLLRDGTRTILWPKDIWDETELQAQRALLTRKTAPRDTRTQ